MQITRKQFLARLVGGAASAALIAACSGSSDTGRSEDPDAGVLDAAATSDVGHAVSCTMNGNTDTIAANHGHVLVVAKTDVVTGGAAG